MAFLYNKFGTQINLESNALIRDFNCHLLQFQVTINKAPTGLNTYFLC